MEASQQDVLQDNMESLNESDHNEEKKLECFLSKEIPTAQEFYLLKL